MEKLVENCFLSILVLRFIYNFKMLVILKFFEILEVDNVGLGFF